MLSALNGEKADYLVVGAYAMAAHGFPRATGDIDIWICATPNNAQRVWQALLSFGTPMRQLSIEDLSRPDVVFQIGVAPRRIDILTSISGIDFGDAKADQIVVAIDGLSVPVLARHHLVENKRASGRPKDMADLAWLESNNDG